jgi:hypothetical protein
VEEGCEETIRIMRVGGHHLLLEQGEDLLCLGRPGLRLRNSCGKQADKLKYTGVPFHSLSSILDIRGRLNACAACLSRSFLSRHKKVERPGKSDHRQGEECVFQVGSYGCGQESARAKTNRQIGPWVSPHSEWA